MINYIICNKQMKVDFSNMGSGNIENIGVIVTSKSMVNYKLQ